MAVYATRDDVYMLGLSAQAFVVRLRPVSPVNVNIATGKILLVTHGLTADDLVRFEVTSGGSLPPEISAFTYYSAIPDGTDIFRVSATPGGSAITFSAAGSGWGVVVDQSRRLDRHLKNASARINECLTAHQPALKPDPTTGEYPEVVVGLCARMAARAAAITLQFDNAAFRVATDRLFALEAEDNATLADWKSGKPIHPRPVDQNTIPDNAPRAGYSRASVGWGTGVL